jgi:prepilin-type N-terminal cleavage/methylation domain-containing protein/prepilin-type processing-associated H-X9-DG protein
MDRSTPNSFRRPAAFTLVELLAAIAILGFLAALIVPTANACLERARQSRKISAARHLMTAYHLAANDNRGRLLAGLEHGAVARNETGDVIGFAEAAKRWPHRLRPYLGDRFRDTLYVNEQSLHYDQLTSDYSGGMLDYMLSLSPSFGMNQKFVGGEGRQLIVDAPVTRLIESAAPGRLVAFAASRQRGLGENSGNFYVNAPAYWNAGGVLSTGLDESEQDHVRGYIDFRNDRVVVAFLDGHVDVLDVERLRDMRLWSEQARLADNPDYVPAINR